MNGRAWEKNFYTHVAFLILLRLFLFLFRRSNFFKKGEQEFWRNTKRFTVSDFKKSILEKQFKFQKIVSKKNKIVRFSSQKKITPFSNFISPQKNYFFKLGPCAARGHGSFVRGSEVTS